MTIRNAIPILLCALLGVTQTYAGNGPGHLCSRFLTDKDAVKPLDESHPHAPDVPGDIRITNSGQDLDMQPALRPRDWSRSTGPPVDGQFAETAVLGWRDILLVCWLPMACYQIIGTGPTACDHQAKDQTREPP